MVKRSAIMRRACTLPVLSLLLVDQPTVADDRPRDACGRRRSPATMPGYHLGRVPANKGKSFPATPLTPDEALLILDRFKMNPVGRRSRALFALLWRSGLRISEGLALMPVDVDMEQGSVFVRCGKGSKARYSGIDQFGRDELATWMEFRAGRGFTDDHWLFPVLEGPNKGVRQVGAPSVRVCFHETARRAGIQKRVAPHQLRHAHACDLAREGVILPYIQRQLGHANPGITGTYLSGLPTTEAIAAIAARPTPLQITSPQLEGCMPGTADDQEQS